MNNCSPIDLRQVTLCAADSINHELALRALTISSDLCTFGEVIFFTHEDVPSNFRTIRIPQLLSRDDYSAFILKRLVDYIDTPWVLIVQWDGYVLDPGAWSQEFLEYDYIGASWPWHRDGLTVGNGGFSLRSRHLLCTLAQERFQVPVGVNEDELICRVFRPTLETEYGIRFAPEHIAELFAYEHGIPNHSTFGFHGAFNLLHHVGDPDMNVLINTLDSRTLASNAIVRLLVAYFASRKFTPMLVLYRKLRGIWSGPAIEARMLVAGVEKALARQCSNTCELINMNSVNLQPRAKAIKKPSSF